MEVGMSENCEICGISKTKDSRPDYWRRGLCPRCYQKHLRDSGRLGARGGKRKSPLGSEEELEGCSPPNAPDNTALQRADREERIREAFSLALEVITSQADRVKKIETDMQELSDRVDTIDGRMEQLEKSAGVKASLAVRKAAREASAMAKALAASKKGGELEPFPFEKGVAQLKNLLQSIYSDLALS